MTTPNKSEGAEDIAKKLRLKAGAIQMGERIAWGSDYNLMYEAADFIETLTHQRQQAVAEFAREVVALTEGNHQGTFTDDAGHDCWYTDELVPAIRTLAKERGIHL